MRLKGCGGGEGDAGPRKYKTELGSTQYLHLLISEGLTKPAGTTPAKTSLHKLLPAFFVKLIWHFLCPVRRGGGHALDSHRSRRKEDRIGER